MKLPKISYRHYFLLLLASLMIISVFALIDYFVHSLSPEYAVPSYYFRNKVIFGTLIGFVVLSFTLKKFSSYFTALIFSATVSILLQIRYYLEGYPKNFVFEFLLWHFLILIFVSALIIKFSKKFLEKAEK